MGAPTIKVGGSANVERLAHVPLYGFFYNGGIEIEQDPKRPFVYIPTWRDSSGFVVFDVSDPTAPRRLYEWRFPDASDYEVGIGETGKVFRLGGRHYYVRALGANPPGGKDSDLCAAVFDVTSLPDTAGVKKVAEVRSGDYTFGCVHVFPYRHSSGQALLFATRRRVAPGTRPHANIYDLETLLSQGTEPALLARLPLPDDPVREDRWAYHDIYAAVHPESGRDILYGAAANGFHIFDVSDPADPRHLGSIRDVAGVQRGHSIVATPTGRYALTQMEYQHSPMRIFDLEPLWKGEARVLSDPIGAWTADWRAVSHNMQVRWPFVFVAAYEDGLQIFEIQDPTRPTTVGWYYTCSCPHESGFGGMDQFRGTSVFNGAVEVDVRNSDGLIVLSDLNTGLWVFRLDGFDRWTGQDWGVPSISSVQDW